MNFYFNDILWYGRNVFVARIRQFVIHTRTRTHTQTLCSAPATRLRTNSLVRIRKVTCIRRRFGGAVVVATMSPSFAYKSSIPCRRSFAHLYLYSSRRWWTCAIRIPASICQSNVSMCLTCTAVAHGKRPAVVLDFLWMRKMGFGENYESSRYVQIESNAEHRDSHDLCDLYALSIANEREQKVQELLF